MPGVVEAPTLNVSVELAPELTDAGLNEAVTPAGKAPVLSATDSAFPLVSAVEMVEAVLLPCCAETLLGLALIEKSFRTMTVSETLVPWLLLGAVPVTVTVYIPGVVLVPTAKVRIELPPAVTELGLKDAVVPEGTPLVLSTTVSAIPLVTAVEIVEVVEAPCVAETLAGLAAIEKSFGTVTVRFTVVECVALAAVPVTVIG